jgi:hypothetical protein
LKKEDSKIFRIHYTENFTNNFNNNILMIIINKYWFFKNDVLKIIIFLNYFIALRFEIQRKIKTTVKRSKFNWKLKNIRSI